jgi:PP-loop superfamily ATP-utilizing enzyme
MARNTSEVTNTTLTEVEVGKHNVTLKLEGYKDSTKQVTIEANETAILDFVLAEIVEPPQYGNLTVNSVPEGASIWLDGEDTSEVTNTTLTEVEVGKHNVTLKLEGYKDSTKQVTIEANETAILDFVLAEIVEPPQYGNLTVNSVPEGASIWLDGEETGKVTNTTLTEVEVGKHNVTLKLEGYKDSTKQVTIEANETAILDFVLAEIVEPPQYGNLTVNSVPEGASIWLDGEETSEVTNTTLTEVEVGKHNVTLKLEGYKDSTKQVTIEANETAILDFVLAEIVEPPQYGNLTVNSVPEGASIWLDGENTSEVTNTTLTEVEVGVHFVKLKLEGYKDSTKQVTIEANETAILDFVLAEIVEPPQYGNLTVNSVPEGASIWLDGEDTSEVTNTTLTEVKVGVHFVKLKLEGYKDSTKQVTIEANETAILDFVLAEIVEPPQYGNLSTPSEGASIWLDGEDTAQVTIEANETAILDFVLAEIVEPPQYGNLTVNSVPEGASIWLDGENTSEVTNTTLTEVEVGKHNVTLKLEGYKDSTKQVTIEANETAILDFVLAEIVEPPQYGNLTVNSVPEGASIWLDGEDTSEVTNTTLTEVEVGKHNVTLKLEGYKDSTKQVTIEANETAILDFVLAEIVEPPQYGNLTVNSVPEGASIWLDGEAILDLRL